MTDAFLAEIRIFPFNFAPTGWAWCDGQLLPLTQNTALFAVIGTSYGGDGRTTFALPDLRGAAAMHPGQGPGLQPRSLGEMGGSDSITLLESEMPMHTHTASASVGPANLQSPGGNRVLARANNTVYRDNVDNLQPLAPQALSLAGGGVPHNNMQPYLVMHFAIALQGIFPSRG